MLELLGVAGTIIGTAGALAVIYVTVRSKLPQQTIQIQNDAIKALEKQNELLKEQIDELSNIVTKLNARVEVIETLPLERIDKNLDRLADALAQAKSIAEANNALLQFICDELRIKPELAKTRRSGD